MTISLGLLGAACMLPLQADDYSKLNFNIGGGVSTPLNPTANFVGVSGNFAAGAGYNLSKSNSIIGEFMWSGLPPSLSVLHPVNAPFGSINLYTLTANYRHSFNHMGGPFGAYIIGGGGWYYRYTSVDKNYVVPPSTVCQPIWTWWGYGCDPNGFIYTATVAYKGVSSGGVNAGVGFTIRLSDSGWKFYMESRYHYAWSQNVPTTLIPVTFGIRFN
jgi:hypothetical protein